MSGHLAAKLSYGFGAVISNFGVMRHFLTLASAHYQLTRSSIRPSGETGCSHSSTTTTNTASGSGCASGVASGVSQKILILYREPAFSSVCEASESSCE